MRLIDADELKKCAIPCEIHNGALTDLCVPLYQIDNAPTVTPDKIQALMSDYLVYRCEPQRPQGDLISRSELKAFIKKYYKQTSQIKSLLSFIDTQKGGAE